MWHDDEQVRRTARVVVNLIADHRGGELSIINIVKLKCPSPAFLQYEVCRKITDELHVFPAEALDLWMTITRLVKEHIIELAQDRMNIWLHIPMVRYF